MLDWPPSKYVKTSGDWGGWVNSGYNRTTYRLWRKIQKEIGSPAKPRVLALTIPQPATVPPSSNTSSQSQSSKK